MNISELGTIANFQNIAVGVLRDHLDNPQNLFQNDIINFPDIIRMMRGVYDIANENNSNVLRQIEIFETLNVNIPRILDDNLSIRNNNTLYNLLQQPYNINYFENDIVRQVMDRANIQPGIVMGESFGPSSSRPTQENVYIYILNIIRQHPPQNFTPEGLSLYIDSTFSRLLNLILDNSGLNLNPRVLRVEINENYFDGIFNRVFNFYTKNTPLNKWLGNLKNSILTKIYDNSKFTTNFVKKAYYSISNHINDYILNFFSFTNAYVNYLLLKSNLFTLVENFLVLPIIDINPLIISIIPFVLISKKIYEIYTWFYSISWDYGHILISAYFFSVYLYLASLLIFICYECPWINLDILQILNYNTFTSKNILIWSLPLLAFDLRYFKPKSLIFQIFNFGILLIISLCFIVLTNYSVTVTIYCLLLSLGYIFYKK